MTLIPRHPVSQNVLCKHDESSGTAEAGAVVYLSGDNKVARVTASGNVPYAMLFQPVRANLAGLPANFEFPGEIGTSVARAGDPVLLYHKGIFETDHYTLSGGVSAGASLYALADGSVDAGKLCASGTVALDAAGNDAIVAVAQESLSAAEAAVGKALKIKLEL